MAVRLFLIVAAAVLAGLAVSVAVAAVTARPVLFLPAGLAVFCVLAVAGIGFVTRRLPDRRRRKIRAAGFTAGALGAVVVAAMVLLPAGDPHRESAPVAGQRFWELPTGSRIAYVRLPTARHAAAGPGGGRPRRAGGDRHGRRRGLLRAAGPGWFRRLRL